MARIPTKEELGGEQYASVRQLPQFRPQDFSGDAAIGRSLAGVGEAGQKVAVAFAEKKREEDEYEVTNRLVQFDLEQEKRLDDAKREVGPEARDFTKSYRDQYDEGARTFMETVPERLRPKVDAALVRRGSNFEKRAYDFELKERDRFHIEDVNRNITDLYNDSTASPNRKDDNAQRGVALIRASRLPANTKMRTEREFLEKNDEFAARAEFERRAAAGEDLGPTIEALRKMPRGTGIARGPSAKFSPEVEGAIGRASAETGVDPDVLRSFVRVESSGNPNTQTGSYRGLFQLSEAEFRKYGGKGSIFNPEENAMAAARKVQAESEAFQQKYGRAPTATDLYLVHQQGEGGYDAHVNNPDQPAWKSMLSTAEGQQKGQRWAKQAIWGNMTPEAKQHFGSVDNVTSGDFMGFWDSRLAGRGVNDAGGTYQLPDGTAAAGAGQALDDPRDEPFEDDTAPYRFLSPTNRRKLLNVARTAQRAVMAQKVEGAIVRVRKGEDLEKDEAGRTAFDTAVEHLTPFQKQEAIAKMETARAYATATRGIGDMTSDEAEEAVDRIRVKADTPENLVAATDRAHRDALTVRNRLETMRKADPVAAVWKGDPAGRIQPAKEVIEAREKIRSFDRNDPDFGRRTWETVIEARVAAQKRTMPDKEPRLLTKQEAESLLPLPKGTKFSDPQFRTILQKAADTASGRYGPAYAKAALADAIRWNISGDDEKRMSASILAKMATGEAITARDLRLEKMRQDAEMSLSSADWGSGLNKPPEPAPVAPKPNPSKKSPANPFDADD